MKLLNLPASVSCVCLVTSDSEELDTLELDLQTVVGCYVVSGTQTQDFCKNKFSSLQPTSKFL